jgi:signal transduction histidine kinase/DNA-binding response OmpR family regulator
MTERYIKQIFPSAEIEWLDSVPDCIERVSADDSTAMIVDNYAYLTFTQLYPQIEDLQIAILQEAAEVRIGINRGNTDLLTIINKAISSVDQEQVNNSLISYTQDNASYSWTMFLRDNALTVVISIVIVAVILIAILLTFAISVDKNRKKLVKLNEEANAARVRADAANRAKSTFLNNMSHDIRTPMNAIIGFTTLAEAHIDNKPQVQDYLSKIMTSSKHLLSLINDVLDMSRIESGRIHIESEPLNLSEFMHEIKTVMIGQIHAKNLDLFMDTVGVHNEDVMTDKLRLNQVMLNVLSNAVKYTPEGGRVSVRVIQNPSEKDGYGNYEFRVKDNGIGMSEEFQKHVFEQFERERNSTVSGIPGTGLGLAITKNIVEMMGGTIEVESKEGVGSEFIVKLELELEDKEREKVTLDEVVGMKALVVDDDANTCDSVTGMLREIGLTAESVLCGIAAVERTKQVIGAGDEFNIYVIDWQLPDINGVETARRIRAVVGDKVPVIILTAYDWSDIEEEAKKAGVTSFCSKPLFMSDLHGALSEVFRKDEQEAEPEPVIQHSVESGKRILLVEDNMLNQEIATEILEDSGFTVEVADNGLLGFERVKASKPGDFDVVLMDIQMPVLDGYGAVKAIRAIPDEKLSKIPIVMMTANAFEEDRQKAAEAGADGYVTKPINLPELFGTLEEILGNKEEK